MSDLEDRQLEEVDLVLVNDEFEEESEHIIRETALKITVNGKPFATAMILAGMEAEYAIGFLYSSGYISKMADVLQINVDGDTVDIKLAGEITATERGPVVSDLVIDHEDIVTSVRAVSTSQLFQKTHATHAAGLFQGGKPAAAIGEDIERHQALEKVIGAGLLAGTDFSRTTAVSTGRQPTGMIKRCRNAGIPIIATNGVPTTKSVALAEESGIAIIGMTGEEDLLIYTHPERIR